MLEVFDRSGNTEQKFGMIRFALVVLLATAYCQPVSAGPNTTPIRVVSQVVDVEQDIRISDIFTPIPGYLDHIIGAAPKPGSQIVLTNDDLARLQAHYDLPPFVSDQQQTVTIRHEMVMLDGNYVKGVIAQELVRNLADTGNVEIIRSDSRAGISQGYALPKGYELTQQVILDSIDRYKKTFQARLPAHSPKGEEAVLVVSGQYIPLTATVVVANSIPVGQVIQQRHITKQWVPKDKIRERTILDPSQILGMEARRQLIEGDSIQRGDVRVAYLVQRGNRVTATYRSPYIILASQMQALEHGAKGDVIRLKNLSSRKIIEGLVVGVNEVIISSY